MAYEFGSKNRFFDRKLQANLSVFYWDYKSEQLSALRPFFFTGQNIGQTSWPYNVDGWLQGAELDLQAALSSNDRLNLNVLYTQGKLKDTPPLISSAVFQVPLHNVDRPNLPKWTVSAGYNHVFQLGGAGSLDAGVGGHYESSALLRLNPSIDQRPGDFKDAYTKWMQI